jgi:hypothetical protein
VIEAARLGLALITSVHASPEDLPGLIEHLDRPRQGVVAYALVSQFITESAREIADVRGLSLVAAVNEAAEGLCAGETVNRPALDRALATVRIYAGVLDGVGSTEMLVPDLDINIRQRQAALSYLIALAQIAHQVTVARCIELGEDVVAYLQQISLPAAEAHGCEIDADALEDYVDALIAERLAGEPLLLTRAAEALSSGSTTLSDEDISEFCELGGNDRLAELTDVSLAERVIALIDCILVASEGDTVSNRASVTWHL